jgi:hypothetical protein
MSELSHLSAQWPVFLLGSHRLHPIQPAMLLRSSWALTPGFQEVVLEAEPRKLNSQAEGMKKNEL